MVCPGIIPRTSSAKFIHFAALNTFAELVYQRFRKVWNREHKKFSFFRRNRYAKPKRKEKETKQSKDESHVGSDFAKLEYAVSRTLVDAPKLHMLYTADVAGVVPSRRLSPLHERRKKLARDQNSIEFLDIGNGDLPPEWAIEVAIYGGSIHYGPWADRQRNQLQRAFFPLSYQDIEPFANLSEGDTRSCTCLKVFFELRDNTTLVVPFKEASKVCFTVRHQSHIIDRPRIGCGTTKSSSLGPENIEKPHRCK